MAAPLAAAPTVHGTGQRRRGHVQPRTDTAMAVSNTPQTSRHVASCARYSTATTTTSCRSRCPIGQSTKSRHPHHQHQHSRVPPSSPPYCRLSSNVSTAEPLSATLNRSLRGVPTTAGQACQPSIIPPSHADDRRHTSNHNAKGPTKRYNATTTSAAAAATTPIPTAFIFIVVVVVVVVPSQI
mmetsp:Transcript_61769/g.102556  ORF Transcript_61769/g.102556 Transcript_61769/m.102556 type:complete len:183 (+) Transcript_61769:1378-1926(+)